MAETGLGEREPVPPIKGLGCGSYHLIVVSSRHAEVYVAGLNNYGQLGVGDEKHRDQLTPVPTLFGASVCQVCTARLTCLRFSPAIPTPLTHPLPPGLRPRLTIARELCLGCR